MSHTPHKPCVTTGTCSNSVCRHGGKLQCETATNKTLSLGCFLFSQLSLQWLHLCLMPSAAQQTLMPPPPPPSPPLPPSPVSEHSPEAHVSSFLLQSEVVTVGLTSLIKYNLDCSLADVARGDIGDCIRLIFFIKQQPESEQCLLKMATKKVKIKCIFPVEHG